MNIEDEFYVSGRPLMRLSGRNHPADKNFPTARKRLCGVCAHFPGTLKDNEAQTCAKLQVLVHPLRGAGRCHRFERKTDAAQR